MTTIYTQPAYIQNLRMELPVLKPAILAWLSFVGAAFRQCNIQYVKLVNFSNVKESGEIENLVEVEYSASPNWETVGRQQNLLDKFNITLPLNNMDPNTSHFGQSLHVYNLLFKNKTTSKIMRKLVDIHLSHIPPHHLWAISHMENLKGISASVIQMCLENSDMDAQQFEDFGEEYPPEFILQKIPRVHNILDNL